MTPLDYHIEAIAGHFVIELDDPECPAEIREDCDEWLASSEEHQRVFHAIQSAWHQSVMLARLRYMRRRED